jgi:hypothetical protein
MLFHISGPAGSGKTTIGTKLSSLPNTIIIDTDQIDDSNALTMLYDDKYKEFYTNEKTIEGFWRILEQKNIESLGEQLEKNKEKNIILVGLTIYPPPETNVQGFSIQIDSTELYFQINKRTIDDLCENCVNLKELFDHEKNKIKIDLETLFKYKIRMQFPLLPYQIQEAVEWRKKYDGEKGYKYVKPDVIIKEITNKINQVNTKESESDKIYESVDSTAIKTKISRNVKSKSIRKSK